LDSLHTQVQEFLPGTETLGITANMAAALLEVQLKKLSFFH